MNTPAVSLPENLNEQFRRAFIEALPEQLGEVERLIRALDSRNDLRAALGELFLAIHRIKGSAGTFGLQILAAICHPFEDVVQEASNVGKLDEDFLPLALDYLTLLGQSAESIGVGRENYDHTEQQLIALHDRAFRRRFSIAVAVDSRMLIEFCRQAAKSLNAHMVEFVDSLNALQRVLSEPFNAIVVSSEMYPMRGEALVAAVKLSHRHGQGLKTILLSSNKDKVGWVKREVDPDFVVLRDKDCLPRLLETLTAIRDETQHQRENKS